MGPGSGSKLGQISGPGSTTLEESCTEKTRNTEKRGHE